MAVAEEAFLNALRVTRNVAWSVEKYAPKVIVFLHGRISREGSGRLRAIDRAK